MVEKLKGDQSFYKAWFDIFPDISKTSPFFYSEEERQLLKGSMFQATFEIYKELIKADYELIVKYNPKFVDKFSYLEYTRTIALVQTRIYGNFGQDTGANSSFLIPFSDMFNYANSTQCQIDWQYND